MAALFNEDDSSDDEIGVNLQLAERLRINRENCKFIEDTSLEDSKELKQICNMHRKKFAQSRNSSSSSSVEVSSDNPSGVSSDNYHNKKRQSGDKTVEQLGNPKRTCLSDRVRRSPEWRDIRNREGHKKKSKNNKFSDNCPDSIQMQSGSPTIISFPRKKKESVNGLADAEDSDFELPLRITRNCKKLNGHLPKSSKSLSLCPDQDRSDSLENRPSTSFSCNAFLESGSDDDSKSFIQNGALKGGRPESSDNSRYSRRLFGRKVNKKVLDSDDSEDDTSINVYRSKALHFSSSDSEKDFLESITQSKANATTANRPMHSLPYENGYDGSSRTPRQPRTFRNNQKSNKKAFNPVSSSRAENSDSFDPQYLSSNFPCKATPDRSCRAPRSPRMNIAANITSNCVSNKISTPVRGRRASGTIRSTRRTSSHHHNHHSQKRCDDSHARSISSAHSHKDLPSLAATYPDLFNTEESENEFFTANSYSDTETSTESLGGVTINASFPTHRGGTISCSIEHEGDGTTDDEIIVLYSAGPYGRTNETRRGGPRTFGRRFSRGSTPHRQLHNTQELVSLSPDPVEQVRQMEEDERMARMLQAQFDAEVDPDYHPPLNTEPEPPNDTDSDNDIIDPVGDSDSDEDINHHSFSVRTPHSNHFRMNRFSNRGVTPVSLGMGFGTYISNNRRFGRNRRFQLTARDNTIHQLARWFGLEVPHIDAEVLDEGLDDYEALLNLEDVVSRGLHKSDINRLPTRKFIHPNSASSSAANSESVHKRTEMNKECQVCLTDYETGDILRILPCFHEFHTSCIDPWLKINHTCPVCRVMVDLDT